MFEGRITDWNTVLSPFKRLEVLELHDDGVLSVRIHVLDNGKVYRLVSEFAELYANINESYQNKLWAHKQKGVGNSFCIEGSSWVEMLKDDPVFSDLLQDSDLPMRHFVVATMDDVIHILSFEEPVIQEAS